MNRAVRRALVAGIALALAGGPIRAAGLTFTDVTREAGIEFVNVCGAPPASKGWLTETLGAGAAWLDFDGDGHLDLYLVNGSRHDRKPGAGEPNRLFRGNGRGGFVDVTKSAGVGDRGWGYGVEVGDYDNDGDPDLYVTNRGPNKLFRNNGDGTLSDVTERAGVGDPRWGASAAFFDADGDGDLDLYLANYMVGDPNKVPKRGSAAAAELGNCSYKGLDVFCGPLGQKPVQDVLYRNEGDGRFKDVTAAAGMLLELPRFSLGVVTGDYDNDGDQDVYVANDSVENSLWRNNGDGTFSDVGVRTLAALNGDGRVQAGMGTDFGDYDDDGWLDVIVTNFAHDLNTLYHNLRGKMFSDDSSVAGLGVTNLFLSWGTGFRDFDLDGDLDLFIANGHIYPQVDDHELQTTYRQRNHVFLNEGGRFVERSATLGSALAIERSFRGAAFADYDNDGDIDVLVTAIDDPPLLMRNDLQGDRGFLTVRLVGRRSNRDGIGARVTVVARGRSRIREAGGGGSYLSASDPRLHFGLGAAKRIERVEVRWPSGTIDVKTGVSAGSFLTVLEGSAPPAP